VICFSWAKKSYITGGALNRLSFSSQLYTLYTALPLTLEEVSQC
jgi:hypothetical protein